MMGIKNGRPTSARKYQREYWENATGDETTKKNERNEKIQAGRTDEGKGFKRE